MSKKLVVYCDLDQTLADLVHAVLSYINPRFNLSLEVKDVHSYSWMQDQIHPSVNQYYTIKGLYDRVPLYPHAQWFVNQLNQMYEFYVISHSRDEIAPEKKDFIVKHFGLRDDQIICKHDPKYLLMKPGSVLIDDYLQNIQPHIYYNQGIGILFNHNNETQWANYLDKGIKTNKHLFATSYYEVLQILKGIAHGETV